AGRGYDAPPAPAFRSHPPARGGAHIPVEAHREQSPHRVSVRHFSRCTLRAPRARWTRGGSIARVGVLVGPAQGLVGRPDGARDGKRGRGEALDLRTQLGARIRGGAYAACVGGPVAHHGTALRGTAAEPRAPAGKGVAVHGPRAAGVLPRIDPLAQPEADAA